jgi:hypothetical protein
MGQQVGLPRLGKWMFSPLRWVLIRFFPVTYLNLQYRYVTGHRLKLFNPTTYTEKLQYLRHVVFPKDPLVIRGTDRVAVRAYLKEKKLTAHLLPVLGIYKRVEDIDWASLPKQFVMKCSHASGFNRIVFDKAEVNVSQLKRQFRRWLATDYGLKTLERHYSPIPRTIIIEKYLGVDHSLPIEYKLHVFHGVVKYLYVVTGRNSDIRYTHFLRDWTPFPGAQFNGWKTANYPVVQPENFAKMIAIAEKLAAPFPFVRVDLYNLKGKIYFSELTFTPAKGTLKLVDAQIDTVMGGWLSIG